MFDVTADCEYGDTIRQFFQSQFPATAHKSEGDTLELVMEAIVSTGKIRLGPKPSIESLYAIRQHLAARIDKGEPIRFVTPWGSEKPASMHIVDVAEVSAIKTLACLQERVKAVYSPGVHVRIRIEDASAPGLFIDRKAQARIDAAVYTQSLMDLIAVLGMDYVQGVPESTMVTEKHNNAELDKIVPAMQHYLTASDQLMEGGDPMVMPDVEKLEAYQHLATFGWKGIIPPAQREHYRNTYRRLYGADDAQATETLARYLSQALVRFRLGSYGNLDWDDYLGLAFNAPVPGEPRGRTEKRIYYRTLPENITTQHMSPWRAKGYFVMSNDGARPRLASWAEAKDYVPNTISITNGNRTATVRCDYTIV